MSSIDVSSSRVVLVIESGLAPAARRLRLGSWVSHHEYTSSMMLLLYITTVSFHSSPLHYAHTWMALDAMDFTYLEFCIRSCAVAVGMGCPQKPKAKWPAAAAPLSVSSWRPGMCTVYASTLAMAAT